MSLQDKALLARLTESVEATVARARQNEDASKGAVDTRARYNEAFDLALNSANLEGTRRALFRSRLGAEFGRRAGGNLAAPASKYFDADTMRIMLRDARDIAAKYDPEPEKED